MEITLSVGGVRAFLFRAIAFLLGLHVTLQIIKATTGHGRLYGLVRLFNVDAETNVPAWFSVMLLFASAVMLAVIAVAKRRSRDPFARHWTGLAGLFLFFSVDEGTEIHNVFGEPTKALFKSLPPFFGFAWVLPFGLFTLVVFLACMGFLRHLEPRERRAFLVAGLVYVGGALIMEMLGEPVYNAAGRGEVPRMYYLACVLVEEGMEMIGAALFATALLRYVRTRLPSVSVKTVD